MDQPEKRHFTISGPSSPFSSYMLPALPRLQGALELVEDDRYFLVHAPRLSGKTTCLIALEREINSRGDRYALLFPLGTMGLVTDLTRADDGFVERLNVSLHSSEVPALKDQAFRYKRELARRRSGRLREQLRLVSADLDKRLVVLFDEAEWLEDHILHFLLKELVSGHADRLRHGWTAFPSSIAVSGQRDIRDRVMRLVPAGSHADPASAPFCAASESLTVPHFSRSDISALYAQHTEATGRRFSADAVERAWRWSEGQPRLVNLLAYGVVGKPSGAPSAGEISGDILNAAAMELISNAGTLVHFLKGRLVREPGLRLAAESFMAGRPYAGAGVTRDDLVRCVDLGLMKEGDGGLYGCRPANPVCSELLLRALTEDLEFHVPAEYSYRRMDGGNLDLSGLLYRFGRFWRLSFKGMRDYYIRQFEIIEIYREASRRAGAPPPLKVNDPGTAGNAAWPRPEGAEGPFSRHLDEVLSHLVLYAFLRKALNGAAEVWKMAPLGGLRADILVTRAGKRYPIELTFNGAAGLEDGVGKLNARMLGCGSPEGWLVDFVSFHGKAADWLPGAPPDIPQEGGVIHAFRI
jgi:hypothetical protein